MTTHVVVTMPAYMAVETLAKTFRDLPPDVAGSVILVDDASTDGTADAAEALGLSVVRHPVNRGYGANQKTCYTAALAADADIIVMLHPDYQYDPKAVPLLIAPILSGDADMTFGSRFAGMSDPRAGGMPLYRYVGNRVTTTIENILLGTRFTELHSGMRAYTRACLQSLPFHRYPDDFSFDSQFVIDAIGMGQRVVEVPIPTRYTKESSSIAIGPSLHYVSFSLWRALVSWLTKGRRGRRSKVRATTSTLRRPPQGARSETNCPGCGQPMFAVTNPALVRRFRPRDDAAAGRISSEEPAAFLQCSTCGLVSGSVEQATPGPAYPSEEVPSTIHWMLELVESYPVSARRRLLEVRPNGLSLASVALDRGWTVRSIGLSDLDEDSEAPTTANRTATDQRAHQHEAVVLFNALENAANPGALLARARECMSDDGLLVLTTTNTAGIRRRLRRSRWPWFGKAQRHYFTAASLSSLLDRHGFRMVEWRALPHSVRLSQILDQASDRISLFQRFLTVLTKVADPPLPIGWLGVLCTVIARPVSSDGTQP
ncbi:MAG: bifunctional glycosyltransferase/class I SAM-dependent methyltransferase [Acidimicrobiia bacterium]|nr:bifunctional glycosyltransferase/class I SAM-dependent methyltransferase [Acidimicrobiia bacterium]